MVDLPNGALFDERYRVEKTLGSSPFAWVALARDEKTQRPVTLKILRPDEGSAYSGRLRARFEREVQSVASLRDAHTVTLFSYGESEGRLFLVFEYVPGRDLAAFLGERLLSASEVDRLLHQMLASLREAHQAGVIHRDVKPGNIIVEESARDGLRFKLIDFGIARATDRGHPSLTATGELLGDPHYLSPEQLLHEPLLPSSDLYCLGLVAWEALFGTRVDYRERLHPEFEFTPPPGAPQPLTTVIVSLTARAVERRPASAAAALRALTVLPVPTPIPAADVPQRQQVHRKPASRWPWMVAGLLLVSMAVAVAGLLWPDTPEPTPAAPSVAARKIVKHASTGIDARPTPAPELMPDLGTDTRPPLAEGVVPSAGCGRRPGRFDEVKYLPRGYDGRTPMPLAVMIHGDYLSPSELIERSGLRDVADADGVILLAPSDYVVMPFLSGAATWLDGAADLAKIRAAVAAARDNLCVDEARIYLLGHGNGGLMANSLACEPWVSALVVNGYAPPRRAPLCQRAVPTLWIYPRDSPHVGIGTPNCVGAHSMQPRAVAKHWRERNHCTGARAVDGCRKLHCETPFEFCVVGGGTLWPPGTPEFPGHVSIGCGGDSAPDFPVAARAWQFFRDSPSLEL